MRFSPFAAALAALLLASGAPGGPTGDVLAPSAEDASLTGREIYARVLENRFQSFIQDSTMVSGDRGGNEQETRLRMHWQNFRHADGSPAEGVLSKTLVRYTHPFEVRHSGYLIIDNSERPSDQFVYFPSRRKVLRVNMRSEAVFGTDFSFEDVLPRELRDAEYRRLDDGTVGDTPTFTVEAIPNESADSEYSRFLIQVDKERYVTLHARYWDEGGTPVKELSANPARIEHIGGVWVPREVTMRHLRLESSTTLHVTEIEPDPALPPRTFTVWRLEAH